MNSASSAAILGGSGLRRLRTYVRNNPQKERVSRCRMCIYIYIYIYLLEWYLRVGVVWIRAYHRVRVYRRRSIRVRLFAIRDIWHNVETTTRIVASWAWDTNNWSPIPPVATSSTPPPNTSLLPLEPKIPRVPVHYYCCCCCCCYYYCFEPWWWRRQTLSKYNQHYIIPRFSLDREQDRFLP
jgi:hypothetical protein